MIVVERTIHPSVVTLRLNRPEKRNALDAESVAAMTQAVLQAGTEASVRGIVITGTGTAFSAGADLAALEALQTASREENLEDSRALAALFEAIYQCDKPVVARVNGHALAGGCGLAAVCDVVVAVDTARFGFTEVRIGFVPAIISVFLLERFPEAVVRERFLSGRVFDAKEAEQVGLVSAVVSADRLDAEVHRVMTSLARDAEPGAVAATKRLLRARHTGSHGTALEAAVALNAEARGVEACRAGIAAFLQKGPFPWAEDWDRELG